MTKKEFFNLKRQVDKLLQKLEDEALEEGENITSSEAQQVFRRLKEILLEKRGISLAEYEAMEEEFETEKKADLDELVASAGEGRKLREQKLQETLERVEAKSYWKTEELKKRMEVKEGIREQISDLKEDIREKKNERKKLEDWQEKLGRTRDSFEKAYYLKKLEQAIENCKSFEAKASQAIRELKSVAKTL